mmetsp:Transcript_18160/g.64358  ORF Transcript_18160/g.64358 Transcript_18160/m.64358 type:complete len:228 (+) Transcript_18160:627-1310(+)
MPRRRHLGRERGLRRLAPRAGGQGRQLAVRAPSGERRPRGRRAHGGRAVARHSRWQPRDGAAGRGGACRPVPAQDVGGRRRPGVPDRDRQHRRRDGLEDAHGAARDGAPDAACAGRAGRHGGGPAAERRGAALRLGVQGRQRARRHAHAVADAAAAAGDGAAQHRVGGGRGRVHGQRDQGRAEQARAARQGVQGRRDGQPLRGVGVHAAVRDRRVPRLPRQQLEGRR